MSDGAFSWLLLDVGVLCCGRCCPWTSGPGLCMRGSWASQEEHPSRAASLPALSSCPGFPLWQTVPCKLKWTLSSPNWSLVTVSIYHSNRRQTSPQVAMVIWNNVSRVFVVSFAFEEGTSSMCSSKWVPYLCFACAAVNTYFSTVILFLTRDKSCQWPLAISFVAFKSRTRGHESQVITQRCSICIGNRGVFPQIWGYTQSDPPLKSKATFSLWQPPGQVIHRRNRSYFWFRERTENYEILRKYPRGPQTGCLSSDLTNTCRLSHGTKSSQREGSTLWSKIVGHNQIWG